jgi:competence protein ComEC
MDAGRQVVAPYLQYRYMKRLDRVIISHGDNDHIGGVATIFKRFSVGDVLTSVPDQLSSLTGASIAHCHHGHAWQWDGVQFQILSPPINEAYQGNNSSCVLKITAQGKSVLLTGDIEKKREKWLLAHYSQDLKASILIAPHHGSRSSSSAAFVTAVNPRYVLFPLGYYNRYKFPAASVVERYQQTGAILLTTADVGAISMHILTGGKITVETMKQQHYFWQVK